MLPEYVQIAVNEMGEPVTATPAIVDGLTVVRTTKAVYGSEQNNLAADYADGDWRAFLADTLLEELSREIIGAAMEVHRTLGPGFVESIYRNALARELHLKGLLLESERDVPVTYKNQVVGRHRLDLVVEGRVIVELKAASVIADVYLAQALSYMKATGIALSLIVNFGGPRLTWKRLVKTQK